MINEIPHDAALTVFIEAPGKSKTIRTLFERIGFSNVTVIATRGRLFDLPEKEIGFSPDNFSLVRREPIRYRLVREIEKLPDKGYALLLTDDDIEGEVIANDLKQIVQNSKTLRVRLHSFTEAALVSALTKATPVLDSSIVMGGIARRVFDRYLGYGLAAGTLGDADSKYSGAVGRITTPVLSAIKNDSKRIVAHINSQVLDTAGGRWNIHLPLHPDEAGDARAILEVVSSLAPPEISVIDECIQDNDLPTLNCGSALILLADTLQESPGALMGSMQELYEDGCLSYPRSDSFYLSPETARQMGDLARHFDVPGFDDDFMQRKAANYQGVARSQGAHEAVVPLRLGFSPEIPLRSLSLRDRVLSVLFRYNATIGRPDRKTAVLTGALRGTKRNGDWLAVTAKLKNAPIITRETVFYEGKRNTMEVNSRIKPLGIPSFTEARGNSTLKLLSKDLYTLEIMLKNDLGRPSTFVPHASKIAGRYLEAPGVLNRLGDLALSHASKYAPGLINPQNARQIEDLLHFDSAGIHERVVQSLLKSGVSAQHLSDKDRAIISEQSHGNVFG